MQLLVIVAVAVPLVVVGAMALKPKSATPATVRPQGASPAALSSPGAKAQACASCWGDGSPEPRVAGVTALESGVQVLKIGIVDGYYEPNQWTVRAGVPVTAVFTGRAEGCLAEPEFPELRIKTSLAGGSATVPLGRLKPGTYHFTCSMGVNKGTITVE